MHPHAVDGRINLVSHRCGHSGCIKQPTCGRVGRKPEFCAGHTENRTIDVASKRCAIVRQAPVIRHVWRMDGVARNMPRTDDRCRHQEEICHHSGYTKHPSYGWLMGVARRYALNMPRAVW